MTNDLGNLVKNQVIQLAQAGEGQQSLPGRAIASISNEIGRSYQALGMLINYVQTHPHSQDAQTVGKWIEQAIPVITGVEGVMNTLLGVNEGKIVAGGVIANAWMLDGAVKATGDQGLYSDPEKVRQLATSWKKLPSDFKDHVQREMNTGKPPITSIADYASLSPDKQEAYTRFDELIKCGGRGVAGHAHPTQIPTLWVPGKSVEATTETAGYLNHALSSNAAGAVSIGRYSSETCAWDQLQDKTPPGALAMVAEKALALGRMFRSIELSSQATDDLKIPLRTVAGSYESIAKSAAPTLYALQPVLTTSSVKGL